MRENNAQTTFSKILNRTIKNITNIANIANITIFLFFAITSASTIYIDPSKETFDEIKWKFSNIDRINFLFDIIDSDPKDDYLYYNELYMYQKATEPNADLKLTPNIYRQLCQLFNANPRTGLTKEEFNSSYYLHSNALGTDLDKDFSIVLDKYITYHTNKQNKYPPNKYPPNSY